VTDLIILNTVVFTAFFLKGIAGFGNTLILNGGLAFIRENRFITPIDTLLGLPVNIFMLFREWRYIRFSIALPMLMSAAAGIIPGILLLDSVNDRILKSILGVVLLIISIDFFLGRKRIRKGESRTNTALIISTGFISGILMGLFGIGVLIPAVLNRMGLDKRTFRGSLCFVFTAESIIRITGYTMRGIINMDIFLNFLFLIPAAFAGVILSRIADRKINDNMIRKIVIIVLIISAVLLIIKNRFGL
jgi:uncharacterized membrane protein YfcA